MGIRTTSGEADSDARADIDGITSVASAMRALQRLRSSKRVHAALMQAADADLSQQGMRVLLAIGDGESVAEISRAAEMDMGAVSRQLRALEDDGLLTRATSPDNGSVVRVHRTSAGRDLARRLTGLRDRHLATALEGWRRDDIDRLSTLLQRLVEDLQATPYPAMSSTVAGARVSRSS